MKKIAGLTDQEKKEVVTLLESTASKGCTIGEVRAIDRLCNLFEHAAGECVNIEDSDYEIFKSRLTSFNGWAGQHRKKILSLAEKLGI